MGEFRIYRFYAETSYSYAFSSRVVRPPGFEPGSSAWEADVLAKLDYDRINNLDIIR